MLARLRNLRNTLFRPEGLPDRKLPKKANAPVIFYILTILFYVAYMLAMEPEWVLSGEMWAEMAVNYYPHANSASWVEKLFATDAGYIPVPQRLIALIGNLLKLSASATAYYYTGSAIVLTGIMVGTFCLKPFRVLVEHDFLRFLTGIAILIVSDFETRTFINFTYYAAFLITIVTALALVDVSADSIPKWTWIIPLLMVSKPAALTALPAMFAVALVSNSRFRWITVTTIVLCLIQIAQMLISQKSGVLPQANVHSLSLLMKASAAGQYFIGLLGGYLIGPVLRLDPAYHMLTGLFFLSVCGLILYKFRTPANSFIILGLLLLFFNALLNTFALSNEWNSDMTQLRHFRIYRHIIVGFFGCILVLLGLLVSVFSKATLLVKGSVSCFVFIVWFVWSGWYKLGIAITKAPEFPWIGSSQWQNNAARIDANEPILCIPINPLGWVYLKNCAPLNPELDLIKGFHFEVIPQVNNEVVYDLKIDPPARLLDKHLASFVVAIRPFLMKSASVRVDATLHLKDGKNVKYTGFQDMTLSGGLIQVAGKDYIPVNHIATITLKFDSPVEIAIKDNDPYRTPGIFWMGF